MACNTKQPVKHCCGCFPQSLWIFQQERSRESKRACHPWNQTPSCCSVHFRINLTLDNRVKPLLISFAVSFFIFLPLAAGYRWSIFEELTVLSMIIKSRGHDTDFGVNSWASHPNVHKMQIDTCGYMDEYICLDTLMETVRFCGPMALRFWLYLFLPVPFVQYYTYTLNAAIHKGFGNAMSSTMKTIISFWSWNKLWCM